MKTTIYLFASMILLSLMVACASGEDDETPPEGCGEAQFEEVDGILVAQIESVPAGSGWTEKTDTPGFSGRSFYQNTESGRGRPGDGLMEYKIKINNAATYRFLWHTKVNEGSDPTDANDSWVRAPDAFDFFGQKGDKIKYPEGGSFKKSNDQTNGSSGDGWMKVYASGSLEWTWSTRTSDNEGLGIYMEFDKAGVYTIQVSRRSTGHALDRLVLYDETKYSESEAKDLGLSETLCR